MFGLLIVSLEIKTRKRIKEATLIQQAQAATGAVPLKTTRATGKVRPLLAIGL